jgi:hypothetical protein
LRPYCYLLLATYRKYLAVQRFFCRTDYCLALKGNHKHLHEFVQQLFAQAQAHSGQEIEHSFYRTITQDHGRTEIRRYWTIPTGEFFFESERWAGLQSIGLVESVRKIGQQTTTSRRYYLNSFVSGFRNLNLRLRSLNWYL